MASPAPASDRRTLALIAAICVAVAAGGGALWLRSRDDGAAASTQPRSASPARSAAVSEAPDGAAERNRRISRQPAALPSNEAGTKAYAAAVAAREPNPGERAFRADALAFFEFNGDLGEEKAAREGITVDELKELTFMGLLAMHLQRWDAIAHETGRELSEEARARGDELVFSASKALKAAIREHVAKGDSAEARWDTIREHQASFIERYRALVGLGPEEYDRLLGSKFSPAPR